jgi:hypothetical protein
MAQGYIGTEAQRHRGTKAQRHKAEQNHRHVCPNPYHVTKAQSRGCMSNAYRAFSLPALISRHFLLSSFTVIPQDDGLMDLWIAGLLGLSSRKTIDTGF